eukprot:s74_g22.t1
MCMSTASTSQSIVSLAIARSGPSPYSPSEIKNAGYGGVDDERADHARFLAYLKINQCGVEMFGVLIDSGLILGVLANDADIFAYLCERPPDGGDLVYVTEGILRLSKRKEEDAPDHEKAADPNRSRCGNSAKAAETDAGFVPHHSYRRKDIEMLPAAGGLTTARLKMFAAAYRFRAGSKMVLVIAPDDAAHYAANPKAGSRPPYICHSSAESSLLWLPLEGATPSASVQCSGYHIVYYRSP